MLKAFLVYIIFHTCLKYLHSTVHQASKSGSLQHLCANCTTLLFKTKSIIFKSNQYFY